MSTTTAAAAATPPAGCAAQLYDIPVSSDVLACAMPYSEENSDILSKCCGDSNIVSYFNNCGLYCLVPKGQTNSDLTDCLYKNGASEGLGVFCNANGTETATASGQADIPETASASVLVTATGSSSDDDEDEDDKDSASKTGDEKSTGKTGSSGAAATSTNAAAGGLGPKSGVSLTGVVIGALLFSATAFGALQI